MQSAKQLIRLTLKEYNNYSHQLELEKAIVNQYPKGVARLDADNLTYYVDVDEFNKTKRNQKMNKGNDDKVLTFQSFKPQNKSQEKTQGTCSLYLKAIKNGGNEWICIVGKPNYGKTYIMDIVSNELWLMNKTVVKYKFLELTSEIKSNIQMNESYRTTQTIDYLKNVDILYIDDLFRMCTDADIKYLYQIIDYRYDNNKLCLFTSATDIKAVDISIYEKIKNKCNKYFITV